MRRFFTVAVMLGTAYLLIATSQAPCRSVSEVVRVTARTTCGPDTVVDVATDTSCVVTLSEAAAGLPVRGNGNSSGSGTLVTRSFYLSGTDDAGVTTTCTLDPNDAGTGWSVACDTCTGDAGCQCSGTLSP